MYSKEGVSLGFDCRSAMFAKDNKIRKSKNEGYKTCPFDIMITNYYGVIKCINDKFKYFMDTNYLEITDNGEIINTKYDFYFLHEIHSSMLKVNAVKVSEFPTEDHYTKNDFENLKIRYNNGVKNFNNYMKNTKEITFILNRLNPTHVELHKCIKNNYPNLKFDIMHIKENIKNRIPLLRDIYKIAGLTDSQINEEFMIK
jgi:Putative papain-like cysteine peptidase (DUF1796)